VPGSLDNQVDVQTGTVRAKARFPNTNQALFPSQFVNLRLQVRTEKDAVVVPITALRLGSSGDYVYVVNADRTVSVRPVQRGLTTADKVAIAGGLQVGERVVTEGADRLKDGASVTLPGDAGGRPAGGASRPAGNASASVRPPADGAAIPAAPAAKTSGPATPGGPAAPSAAPTGADTSVVPLPTPEQRKRLLGAVKDDPVQLERRQRLLEAIDRGDPAALERWKSVRERLNASP
jgi:multidrug efflux system membrane fusion protein